MGRQFGRSGSTCSTIAPSSSNALAAFATASETDLSAHPLLPRVGLKAILGQVRAAVPNDPLYA